MDNKNNNKVNNKTKDVNCSEDNNKKININKIIKK